MTHNLQIYKGKKGGWYIRIIARNGKIVADVKPMQVKQTLNEPLHG